MATKHDIRGGHFMRLTLTQLPHYRTGLLPPTRVAPAVVDALQAIRSAQIESHARAHQRT